MGRASQGKTKRASKRAELIQQRVIPLRWLRRRKLDPERDADRDAERIEQEFRRELERA